MFGLLTQRLLASMGGGRQVRKPLNIVFVTLITGLTREGYRLVVFDYDLLNRYPSLVTHYRSGLIPLLAVVFPVFSGDAG